MTIVECPKCENENMESHSAIELNGLTEIIVDFEAVCKTCGYHVHFASTEDLEIVDEGRVQ